MLDSKDPDEIITVTFDFTEDGIAPQNPAVTVPAVGGTPDAAPAAILDGVPVVIGNSVLQRVRGGNDGALYELRCEVDSSDGSRLVLVTHLPVATQH